MNKSLDGLVSTLEKSELCTSSEFLKNYVQKISDNPDILNTSTHGLYTLEIPGETFEIAKLKKKKTSPRKPSLPLEDDGGDDDAISVKRMRADEFLDDDVEVEDDTGEEETDFDIETAEDRKFINDGDSSDDEGEHDDGSMHRAFDQQNPATDEPANIYPPNDYRRNPYTSPELDEAQTELYDSLFEVISSKGVYFYEYVTSLDVLDETKLPKQEDFYSHLTDESITDKEYARAKEVWEKFKMKTLWNYHDLYLIMDVLLLADVLLAFQKVCHKNYGIDPLHSYTTPGFGWQSLLKMTDIELELFSEDQKDLYLFFEAAKRGGLATISHRHLKANIPDRADFDPEKPASWIMYLDANNLYGKCFCILIKNV